jgi:hypothetical protein
MLPALRRLALAGTILALVAGTAARADVLPEPTYVAGLWFYAHNRFNPDTRTVVTSPTVLMSCEDGHPNCKAANAANVVGAEVVSVGGKAGADPNAAFGQAHPPARITVVFRRDQPGGKTTLIPVTFASK